MLISKADLKQSEQDADSVFNISVNSSGFQKLYVHFPKAVHEDFSFLPSLGNKMNGAEPVSLSLLCPGSIILLLNILRQSI